MIDVDVSMSRERQLESFTLLKTLIRREYHFSDKEAVRDFFTRLTGQYKNFNYSPPNSQDYKKYKQEIEDLAARFS